ncbi:hypothetical protein M436DRAFT_63286 [Aureobasidium namibiae CBS 147.97]|uniref:Uncharacterized protein n=1 Tax=Aureobasidium namibiae CBS 147.97 TaxID=1043004 RepID=A0A074WW15_9PEZI|nr:uncharacterized protein M436DRAFT_63286 [Aureobasidium namibiae CBS 147.97]KEQ73937.1 hypothetical protein M436DRAFT_63286 [Aureobasidium namibiae CBS 147.97]
MARFTASGYELVVTIYAYVATVSEDAHTKVASRIGFSSRNPHVWISIDEVEARCNVSNLGISTSHLGVNGYHGWKNTRLLATWFPGHDELNSVSDTRNVWPNDADLS